MKNILTERPSWLKKRLVGVDVAEGTRKLLAEESVRTVCDSAICPNRNECFSNKQATFLILGNVCTRACSFCSVSKGFAQPVDENEPDRIAAVIKKLDIRYAVITSVTRDDLRDGGAGQFADVIAAIRRGSEAVKIEVLTPDFRGDEKAIRKVVEAKPEVFGHNIETVERLYKTVRPGADYRRSLKLLRCVKDANADGLTKSSIMVGLGEDENDIVATMRDLRCADCDILTIGQYLRPRQENIPISRYVTPREFEKYKDMAIELGFKYVVSGPFVRSSYKAEEAYSTITGGIT